MFAFYSLVCISSCIKETSPQEVDLSANSIGNSYFSNWLAHPRLYTMGDRVLTQESRISSFSILSSFLFTNPMFLWARQGRSSKSHFTDTN